MAASLRSSLNRTNSFIARSFTTVNYEIGKKGLVLGAYSDGAKGEVITFTEAGQKFDDQVSGGLTKQVQVAGLKKGKARLFYNLTPDYAAVAVVGLGKKEQGYNELEEIDESKESVRIAAAVGCKKLQDIEVSEIFVEDLGDSEAAAEGAVLGPWIYQESRNKEKQKKIPQIQSYNLAAELQSSWNNGVLKAEAQNLSRRLMDTPANLMTPTIFAKNVQEILTPLGVEVIAHDRAWAESQKMGSYLSVTRGSAEPPVFLEMSYKGARNDVNPVVFVGKGITFDSGGISLKPSSDMDFMRADMGGAACVVATLYAVAKLKLPINVVGLTPMCENMPGGKATKPGDVVTAMNGKTIKVDNTDAEGRLILADALCYAARFNPKFTLDIATLTGAMGVALGQAATGVFSNSQALWEQLHKAGTVTGDRMWRFPLWDHYSKRVTDFSSVDVNNIAKGKGGGSCTAAAFLRQFAPEGQWTHLDIAGVMGPADDHPCLQKGMTGRPTRTLIQLLMDFAKK